MDGYKHILVPLDGSECSERALVEAERLQEAFGARLTLLYVVSDPDFDCTMGSPAVTNASVQRDCAGCVAKSILAATEKLGCDLIVMGSQGLGSALRRFLVGSVAKNVLSNATVPVMIVH